MAQGRASRPSCESTGSLHRICFPSSFSWIPVTVLPFLIRKCLNWLDWSCRVFTPMLSDYWAELYWVATPSQRAMSQLPPPPPAEGPEKHFYFCFFSAPKLIFVFSHSFLCPAYYLPPFQSKDIHQRNMAPPSLVTPTALCQLSEPESSDCGCCRRWRRRRRRRRGYRQRRTLVSIANHE